MATYKVLAYWNIWKVPVVHIKTIGILSLDLSCTLSAVRSIQSIAVIKHSPFPSLSFSRAE